MPSLFGWLDSIPWWRDLSYPVKGALLRALKSGLSVIVGILLAAATGGVLFPVTYSPLIVLVVTMVLQSIDKFLRETQVVNEVKATDSTLGPVVGENTVVNTDATVVTPKV